MDLGRGASTATDGEVQRSSEAAVVIVCSRGPMGRGIHRVSPPLRVSRESKSCGSSNDVTELSEGVWMDISHGNTKALVAGLSRGSREGERSLIQ